MRSRKEDNLVRKRLWLEQCASATRRTMTPSELRLWSALSARKLGVQFRREVPLLGRFIVDLRTECAARRRGCGACHADRRAADARRDAALERAGYRVLRIEAALVMRDLHAAVALVRATL
jgi:very-short-patch-repair endonuclease